MLKFDAETSALLNEAYQGTDFAERRHANFKALDPRPGQHLTDLGCGNGMLAADLAEAVGADGITSAVDPSPEMRAMATERLSAFAGARVLEGGADDLPLDDESQDGVVSVQVFEYIADLAAALSEVHRVLKPGGRLVIGDQHFDSFAWFSDDPDRMATMKAAWDHHFVHRDLPAILPAHLRAAGFTVDDVTPVPCTDAELRPDGLAQVLIRLSHAFATQNGHVDRDIADAWRDEQYQLARDGRFFFCLTHYVTTATRR